MDPLCEKYYHISPYAYAGNNFVNCIDYMGLAGYAFNATTGRYERKIEGDGPNYGVIVDDNGQHLSTFEFADPINDPEAIEKEKINHILFVSDEQIARILEESGVYDTQNQENKYSFIYYQSDLSSINGDGKMDYVCTGMYNGANISCYTNRLKRRSIFN
ncbi:MAG: hypothetical protein K6A36_03060 [Paludibacteraceae bacterium]|nr:hypothetical protein [Paludibacteraceae bacterium]